MIQIEKTEVLGWEPAIRGMRNPMNSWENSDSRFASLVANDPASPLFLQPEADGHDELRSLGRYLSYAERPQTGRMACILRLDQKPTIQRTHHQVTHE